MNEIKVLDKYTPFLHVIFKFLISSGFPVNKCLLLLSTDHLANSKQLNNPTMNTKIPTKLLSLVAAASLAASASFAQDNAVTSDVVGYVTLTINGTGGVGSEAYSYIGAPMHSAASASGSISSTSDNTITSTGSTWTENAFSNTHYVLVTSGTNEGISAPIVSNTADTLTTAENLNSLLNGDETFEIRAYVTISDVFGASNEAGLDGGASVGAADNILVQDGASFNTYYYKNAGLIGGTGWRSSSSPIADAGSTILPHGSGFIVVRRQSSDIELITSGSVFSSDVITPVETGFNWKTASVPVDLTLSGVFGANNEAGLVGGSSAGSADNILVFDDSGSISTYYYKNAGLIGGTGWRSSSSPITDQASTVIASPGKMFLINRSGGAFNLAESSPL